MTKNTILEPTEVNKTHYRSLEVLKTHNRTWKIVYCPNCKQTLWREGKELVDVPECKALDGDY